MKTKNKITPPSVPGMLISRRESLVILASLGTTKEYLGVEMSLEKIHKLPDKEVEKFFNRYQKSSRAKDGKWSG